MFEPIELPGNINDDCRNNGYFGHGGMWPNNHICCIRAPSLARLVYWLYCPIFVGLMKEVDFCLQAMNVALNSRLSLSFDKL